MTRPRFVSRSLLGTSATLAGVGLAVALSGCGPAGDAAGSAAVASDRPAAARPPAPHSASPQATGAPPATAQVSGPGPAGDSAAATPVDAAKVRDALAGLAAGGVPGTESVREALVRAGYAPETIEVTARRTPTGLDADAVEASVRAGNECVVAQLRARSVTAAVLPALAGGRCLAGPAV